MKIPRNKRRIWSAAAARVIHDRAMAARRTPRSTLEYPTLHRAFLVLRMGARGTFEIPTWRTS